MTKEKRIERLIFLADRIKHADGRSELAGSIVIESQDELIGAIACGLEQRTGYIREKIKRHSEDRDIWAAAANGLRAERDGLKCDDLAGGDIPAIVRPRGAAQLSPLSS